MITNKLIREAARDSKHSSLQGLENEAAQVMEWEAAQNAAHKLVRMLTDENFYVSDNDNKLRNMYAAIAWVRLSRTIATLEAGMACIRLAIDGKSNLEIEMATGIPSSSISLYKSWNTLYAWRVEQMLSASKGKSAEQRSRALRLLFSNGVTF